MSLLNIDGINIYYEVYGEKQAKETIYFLNGVMASANSWHGLIEPLIKLGYQVVLHDFMGQLKSDAPEGPYTFKDHIHHLLALSEHLETETFHLIGTSYGSEVAMRMTLDYPEKVLSLSLIDGVSEIDEVTKRFVESWKPMCDYEDPYDFFWGMAPSIYGNEFLTDNKEFLEERALAMRKMDRSYFEGLKRLIDTFVSEVDFTNELHQIKCPTQIIVGEDDLLKRVKFSRMIAEHIAHSELYILPNCGHVTIFEKPKELQTLLTGFLLTQEK